MLRQVEEKYEKYLSTEDEVRKFTYAQLLFDKEIATLLPQNYFPKGLISTKTHGLVDPENPGDVTYDDIKNEIVEIFFALKGGEAYNQDAMQHIAYRYLLVKDDFSIVYDRQQSYVQGNPANRMWLVRLSMQITEPVNIENLMLDYIIDLSNIQFEFFQDDYKYIQIDGGTKVIPASHNIIFKTIMPTEIPLFPRIILDYPLSQRDLYDEYFRY